MSIDIMSLLFSIINLLLLIGSIALYIYLVYRIFKKRSNHFSNKKTAFLFTLI